MSIIAFFIIYFALGTLIFYRDVKTGHLDWDTIEAKINELPGWGYLLVMATITLMVLFLWVPGTVLGIIKGLIKGGGK